MTERSSSKGELMGEAGTIGSDGENLPRDRFWAAVASDGGGYGGFPSSNDETPIAYAFPAWLSLDIDSNFGDRC
jgi:hypothetical protein